MPFTLTSEHKPAGDQPKAIEMLADGLSRGMRHQTLLGVTGSGKTFTVANVIKKTQKPTLVIAHNKTLAAQLAQEYRDFFPNSAVHYFVSYYDYYQPEAYVPASDTYIEKETQINEEIDRLRHAATQALLSRRDVIIVASVSCIYGLGRPEEYAKVLVRLSIGNTMARNDLMRQLVSMYFIRTTADLKPGTFRATGNTVEIMPIHERRIYRVAFSGGAIVELSVIDAITRAILENPAELTIFPAKHFVTAEEDRERAHKDIQAELAVRLKELKKQGRVLEHERLRRRTQYDLALIREVGYCNGIENYSRHFDRRKPGDPPYTLLSYFPRLADGTPDFLTIIDESHVTVPQIRGMQAGDRSRKQTLVDHGFRLPSAIDNRPLSFDEFSNRVGQIIYTSATPAEYELEQSKKHGQIAEQIIRPTGLVDPELAVRPVIQQGKHKGQIGDFLDEAETVIKRGGRVLVTTLTKKMAEDLSEYLKERGIKSEYIHSDIKTIDRIEILTKFRRGEFDCIVGVNLLREGLDLPEVELIGILDADKEGFLRSETSLIQIIGRAARNVLGRVILYADRETPSLKMAIGETNRRRALQLAYNKKHGITPQTIKKEIRDITEQLRSEHERAVAELVALEGPLSGAAKKKRITVLKRQMTDAVKELDFETAAILRDEIKMIQSKNGHVAKKGR